MKRVIAILLLLPATAFAQEPTIGPAEGVVEARPAALASATTGVAPEQAPAAAATAASGPRRRPSMVGYIESGTIESSVRLRFDAGFGMSTPDRAEFFYGKCGCYRGLPPSLNVYDPNAAGPGPGVLTNLNFQQLYVLAEFAPMGGNVSFFGELPFRFLEPQSFAPGTGSFPSSSGVSDLRTGVKVGVVNKSERQVTASVQFSAPTGDALKGLGTNHWSVQPLLLYQERPNDRFAIEAQFGDVIPTGGSAGLPTNNTKKFSGNVLYYGIGPSYEVYRSSRMAVAPVVELVGWHILSGFQTGPAVADASGINIVNIKVGTRILFNNDKSSIYVGYGHALTTDDWYNNILRLEYRLGF
jgi:hypothetical protein